ncbi:MAG: hypothetical protein PCFJNLEI_02000 [Verrucomicrobiae bacterium]|nr:hypothetical protein [Verrucomicrobiae bacterium]
MKNFIIKITLVAAVAACAFLGWRNGELRRQVATYRGTVQLLEKEKRDLQQQAVTIASTPNPAEQAALLAQTEKQTSALRGLPFKHPVTYKSIGRDELKKFLQGKIAEQYSTQEMHDYGQTLITLGLLPAGTDLAEAILGLYDEQVAAFYVPEERALYTFKEKSFDSALDKITLAHELTHALQDQNYDLTKLPLRIKDNDDLALATSALVEGDATLLMAQYYGEYLDARNMIGDVLGGVLGQKTSKFQAAPAFLRESMLFPYQQGTEFATAIFAAGGLEALDAAFRNPPVSTSEILHPEKYLRDRRVPEKIVLPVLERAGWRLIGNNVLGEFGLRNMFTAQQVGIFEAHRAAGGWNGDRFHVYERGTNGPCFLVWETAWDTEKDAEEFVSSYRHLSGKRGVTASIQRTGSRVAIRQANTEVILTEWSSN